MVDARDGHSVRHTPSARSFLAALTNWTGRMATDLNLHRKSLVSGLDTEEGRARDLEVSC